MLLKKLDTKKREYRIYALLTGGNELFYIGKTKNHPNERIRSHIYRQTNKEMEWRFSWFKQYDEMPYYFTLERKLTEYEAFCLEKIWIDNLLKQGFPLLNKVIHVTRKQRGCHNIKITPSDFDIQQIFAGKVKANTRYGIRYSD